MCEAVFSVLEQNYQNTVWLIPRAIITNKNIILWGIINAVIKCFSGEDCKFLSCNTVEAEQGKGEIQHSYHLEILSKFKAILSLLNDVSKLRKLSLKCYFEILTH